MIRGLEEKYKAGDYKSIVDGFPNDNALVSLTPKELMMIAWAHHHRLNATAKELSGIQKDGARAFIIGVTDEVLEKGNTEDKISALKLKPLHLWGLGARDEALSLIEQAAIEYSEDGGLWNTKALIEIYAKKFADASASARIAINCSLIVDDYRTAGNAARQLAICFKEFGDMPAAFAWLSIAELYWTKSQKETGWDAKIHIDGLANLIKQWTTK